MDWGSFFAENGAVFFWLLIAIAAAVVEVYTCDLVSIWFVPGALAAMLLSLFVHSVWWQIAVFLALSVTTLVLAKTVFKKHLPQSKPNRMNADALIGSHGIVEETVDNLRETGSVKVKSLVWTARSTDDAVTIPAGSLVTIREIRGVKLICEPRGFAEENLETDTK